VKVSPKDPPKWNELIKQLERLEHENENLKGQCKAEQERSKRLCIENSTLKDHIKGVLNFNGFPVFEWLSIKY